MLYNSGKFGIEYNARRKPREASPLGPVLVFAAVLALISLVVLGVGRLRRGDKTELSDPGVGDAADVVETRPAEQPRPTRQTERETVAPPPAIVSEELPKRDLGAQSIQRRPREVKNLLLRLKEAMRQNDLSMAVSTIEKIRSLPGDPAADLDDDLARQLGVLNYRWLVEGRNPQWVETVVVKSGDSMDRLSKDRGATRASTVKLNPTVSPDRIRPGQTLSVMKHPHFRLTICRCARTADLYLNDKFFKRYDLTGDPTAEAGAYELTGTLRKFLAEHGIALRAEDRAELEMLLPSGSSVLVAEK